MSDDDTHCYLALIASKSFVKQIKDGLESYGKLNKRIKIKTVSESFGISLVEGSLANIKDGNCCIPVTEQSDGGVSLLDFIHLTQMQDHKHEISLVNVFSRDAIPGLAASHKRNVLARTIQNWLQQRSWTAPNGRNLNMSDVEAQIDSRNWTYTIYPPLLLISSGVYASLSFLVKNSGAANDVAALYHRMCTDLEVNRIAINAPIPNSMVLSPPEPCHRGSRNHPESEAISTPNVLRSPTGLTPLYGDFGPSLPSDHAPRAEDFDSAFWCTARQNGIFQTWAPRYTMFSRGNISEKARLLRLNSLGREKLERAPRETSAVDMYAGIGYFAFSYAKAGVGKVLCWEINPWSVEGLRRGAKANGWEVCMMQGEEIYGYLPKEDCRFLVFQESNEHAPVRINSMRAKIPPIKHVNCGYLPSSKDSWDIAVQLLDSTGGWIHAHENVAKKDIEARKAEVVAIFGDLLKKCRGQTSARGWKIECEHVHQIKSYAPGIIHCVLDIALFPEEPS